jgi:spermidine/putrescine transport system permease protein
MGDKGRTAHGLRRRLIPYGLLGPGAIWLVLFFLVPMYFMGEMSLRSGVPNTPEGFTFSWDFSNYSDALEGRGEQIVRTFYYAGAATIIALLIAYPLAYAIALKVNPRWRLPLLFAVIAPFFTTYLIRTVAWETILADDSPIVDLLKSLQVIPTSGAVIAGLTYNFLPFMILPIYASLERIDTSLIEAGKDLYASARQAFIRVTLPLTMPGVVAGVLLTFIPASGDYINAEFLGGATNTMIGNRIQATYLEQSDYPEAAAMSFLMMAAVLTVVFIYIRLAGTEAFIGSEEEAR